MSFLKFAVDAFVTNSLIYNIVSYLPLHISRC